jgi:hypothetical protein
MRGTFDTRATAVYPGHVFETVEQVFIKKDSPGIG